MATAMQIKVEALRAEAWDAVLKSEAYALFRALDDAVVAMGGHRLTSSQGAKPPERWAVYVSKPTRRISHANAAATALQGVGRPMIATELMEAAIDAGALIGGEKPLVNLTSTLSKDDRFHSFRRGAHHFWWLTGVPLPSGWNEPEPDSFDVLLGAGSTFGSSQEGGDGHGPPTT